VLTLYRRHTRKCSQQDRYYRRCKCPVWVEGTTDAGQYIRRSLKLNNWERAEEEKRELEGVEEVPPFSKPQQPKAITVRGAFAAFYEDCQARNLNDSTLRKYRLLRDRLTDFAGLHCPSLKELNIERLRAFRSTWKDGPRAAGKKIDRLRTFFRFCIDNQWIERNPALSLKAPLVKDRPTLPFSREEMVKIIDKAGVALAFILTLRYTGMRISDAAMLRTSAVDGNRVFLYTQKTGTPYMSLSPRFSPTCCEPSNPSAVTFSSVASLLAWIHAPTCGGGSSRTFSRKQRSRMGILIGSATPSLWSSC